MTTDFKIAKHTAKTPRKVSTEIRDFCNQIAEGADPVFITIYEPRGRIGRCFDNSAEEAKKHGGEVTLGWTIWEFPGAYLTAEFHSVVARDGTYIDVTPQIDGSRRVLFLPTPGVPRPSAPVVNRYQALDDDPLLEKLIALQTTNLKLFFAGKAGTAQWWENDRAATRSLDRYLRRNLRKRR